MIQLFNGDCLEVMKELPDNSIDLIVTDPPYKLTSRGGNPTSGGMIRSQIGMRGQVFNHNDVKIEQWLPILYKKLKESGHCYIMTNHKNLHHFLNITEKTGFHFIKSLIWDKQNKIMGQYYMSQYEYILFLRKGKGIKINNCGTPDILSIKNKKLKDANNNNLHDTEKPIQLMKILIENSSKENETVLDPFMGIGSTGLACIELNRDFIGIELDRDYFDISEHRIQEASKS